MKRTASIAIASLFGVIAFSNPAAADEPFKENGRVYIGGFVPEEAVTVVYEDLTFTRDFRADTCGTIRLKASWPTFHYYSTVNVNRTPVNIDSLNPIQYWAGNPPEFVKNRYSCTNGKINDTAWSSRWTSLGGGLKAVRLEGSTREMYITGLGYTIPKVTTDAAPGRTLRANSCGFITLSASDRWPLSGSFYFYTVNTDPSASYTLASLPEQPALLCRNGVFYQPAQ